MKKCILIFFFLLIKIQAKAQLFDRVKDGVPIRSYVLQLGAMPNKPLSEIIDSFRAQKYDEIKMTFAIYTWIAENIAFDSKGYRIADKISNTTTATLKNRTATSAGYSELFQTMCNVAGIKCYTVSGITKTHPIQILNTANLPEHTWNVVFIKNWLLFIDVTKAAGFTDYKGKNFIKEFSDAWFFTNKDLFLLNHFTKDKNNPLPKDASISKSDFLRAPIVYGAAVSLDIRPSPTLKGKLRGRKGSTTVLQFELKNLNVIIKQISISTRHGEVNIPIKRYENILEIEIPFTEAGEYGITLKVNGANIYGFMAVVSENKR